MDKKEAIVKFERYNYGFQYQAVVKDNRGKDVLIHSPNKYDLEAFLRANSYNVTEEKFQRKNVAKKSGV